ncbi:MAG: ribosome maturation factor RimP [Geovibrio sp.]|uniref:ribosome maturation factor RimP n=1 Tax=Geovibrio ferrireducens TaxID=46201 RepID=UPI002246C14D|nr:ribosome maturation factor RimP [Geovibrio ferrireducens]MCD8493330.1 ribosome maturation factor RimP [Geovibrio sp.]MCD8568389.1 ribosome maturation factor RimP [Geovibrio sp.]
MGNFIEKDISSKVRNALVPIVKEIGVDIFDVTFRREKTGRTLRIVIDREDCLPGLDECAEISRRISKWLDEADFIPYDGYSLEVSTPGLERPLRSEKDFLKFSGKICKVTAKEKDDTGRKSYTGTITGVENGVVKLFVEKENKEFCIKLDNIAKAVLQLDF